MKLFTKNTFRNLALAVLGAAALSACGGAGSCATCTTPTPAPGDLTLKIEAPTQYPAGLATPIEASLTMTNTSSVDANNLVYNIPLPNQTGNYTGVVITPNAGIGSQSGACTNIAAGASCTFSATIAAYANPGSFTVTATPNGSTSSATKATQAGKSLQAGGSISVTANLGLVDVPNTSNEYYVLPSDQTVQGSTGSPSTVYVSVWVKQAGAGLNSLKLVDELGTDLTYVAVGTPSYALNSVNSYKVTIPAGKTIQHIQVLSNTCTTLNNGENNNTACSNDADVNLAQSGVGILAIQPNYFQMSSSHESQVVTLQNVGTANITAMQMPVIAAPFNVAPNSNTCTSNLAIGASCKLTLIYTPGSTSGQGSYVVNYNNGTSAVNTTATIPYAGSGPAPYAILTASPTSFSLSESHPLQRITVTNTGTAVATGITLPTLTAPLTESVGFTTCTAGSSLPIGSSCSYAVYIDYTQAQSAGRESVTFSYNNGQSAQTTSVAVDWSQYILPQIGFINACEVLRSGSSAGSIADNSNASCMPITVSIPESVTSDVLITMSIPQSSVDGYYFASGYGATPQSSLTDCTVQAGRTSCDSALKLCVGVNSSGESMTVTATASGYVESSTVVLAQSNPPQKYIFVTSATYNGDLKTAGNGTDGFDGANKLCQAAANAGSVTSGLNSTWKAMLSTNNATKTCQFYKNTNSQYLGKAIGGDFVGLLAIPNADAGAYINKDENTNTVDSNYIFTGWDGQNCNNWTSNLRYDKAGLGSSMDNSNGWWGRGSTGCSYTAYTRLYCVQQ